MPQSESNDQPGQDCNRLQFHQGSPFTDVNPGMLVHQEVSSGLIQGLLRQPCNSLSIFKIRKMPVLSIAFSQACRWHFVSLHIYLEERRAALTCEKNFYVDITCDYLKLAQRLVSQ
jgi:hypothetical protein